MLSCYISFQVFYLLAGAVASHELVVENSNGTAAVPTLDEVMAQHPVSVEGLIDKGHALYSLKEYELSLGCYNDALKIDPNSSIAWYGKGCSLAGLGKMKKQLTLTTRLLQPFQFLPGTGMIKVMSFLS